MNVNIVRHYTPPAYGKQDRLSGAPKQQTRHLNHYSRQQGAERKVNGPKQAKLAKVRFNDGFGDKSS
jgi:hypothetical protein